MTIGVVPSATPASQGWCSVWQLKQSTANRRRSSRQLPALKRRVFLAIRCQPFATILGEYKAGSRLPDRLANLERLSAVSQASDRFRNGTMPLEGKKAVIVGQTEIGPGYVAGWL